MFDRVLDTLLLTLANNLLLSLNSNHPSIYFHLFLSIIRKAHYIFSATNQLFLQVLFRSLKIKHMHSSTNILSLVLTLSRKRFLSYRKHSIDLLWKSMDWFLYHRDHRHERVKSCFSKLCL